jgi:hypothetical protein
VISISDNPDDFVKDLFGPVIFSYTDTHAINDGVLIPFYVNRKDTGHRITSNAFKALKRHHAPTYPNYETGDFYHFFFNELLPLVPEAFRVYKANGILTTDFDFRVAEYRAERSEQLWYLPNEVQGVTMMKPEDY